MALSSSAKTKTPARLSSALPSLADKWATGRRVEKRREGETERREKTRDQENEGQRKTCRGRGNTRGVNAPKKVMETRAWRQIHGRRTRKMEETSSERRRHRVNEQE